MSLSSNGDGSNTFGHRGEIPDWFYDTCYAVVDVKAYLPEEQIAEYPQIRQQELRARDSYPIGSILCYCSSNGNPDESEGREVHVIERELWEHWQEILTVHPTMPPKEGNRIMSNCDDQYGREYWFRTAQPYDKPQVYDMPNLREDVQWLHEDPFSRVDLW